MHDLLKIALLHYRPKLFSKFGKQPVRQNNFGTTPEHSIHSVPHARMNSGNYLLIKCKQKSEAVPG